MEETVEMQGKWYTLQVLSNQENKVRDTIKRQLELADAVPVYDVCIPTGKVLEIKDGTRRRLTARCIPAMYLSGWIFTVKTV